jgi:hypothetical protein
MDTKSQQKQLRTYSDLYEVTHEEREEVKAWKLEIERKRGADDARREIALLMLRHNKSLDEIVLFTKLRKAGVEKMKREMGDRYGPELETSGQRG